MATSKPPNDSQPAFEQDPLVDRLRPNPSAPPLAALVLEGLAGRSTREGFARLYFDTTLNHYAEFASADLLFSEAIPPELPPFVGHKATRVGVRQDAVVDYTRTATAQAGDPFALDVQKGSAGRPIGNIQPSDANFPCSPATIGVECPTQPFGCPTDQTCGCGTGRTNCVCPTDNTCRTDCGGATCNTCRTDCGQATCHTCNQATCHTCNQATCQTCNQATCNTCATNCQQATCNTCRTDCGGRTCVTCDTCNPHIFTCGNQHGCM